MAKVAAALLLAQRGTPFMYYGDELGLADVRLARSRIQDPPGRRYWPFYRGRDGCRAPLFWDAGPNGGFTTGSPWMPLADGFRGRNAGAQRRDPRSAWSFYRHLLSLRRGSGALRRGIFERIGQPSRSGLAHLRVVDDDQALAALNFHPRQVRPMLGRNIDPAGWRLALSAHPDREASLARGAVDLGPFQAAVFVGS